MYLGGKMHLKPTAGCQISTLIFENKIVERVLYKYPMKNISRTAKVLALLGFNLQVLHGFLIEVSA
jgi:hypothetical protein